MSGEGGRWSHHGHTCVFDVPSTHTKRDDTHVTVVVVMAVATTAATVAYAVYMYVLAACALTR